MYRIVKALNHNTVIVLSSEDQKRYLVLAKGIGFGRKISQRIEIPSEAVLYTLEEATKRGDALSIVGQVDPRCLEIAGLVLDEAQRTFGRVDRRILFPMADHLAFAVKRMQTGEVIRNPLKDDIRLLFHAEYKTACAAAEPVREAFQAELTDDEIGFLALHVHSAIENEDVAQSLQTAQIVRDCISYIEEKTGARMEILSINYNRMMNHIRYMVTRMEDGEQIRLNLNDYMKTKYPEIYTLSEDICNRISRTMKKEYHDSEIGYLAMHIARVMGEE